MRKACIIWTENGCWFQQEIGGVTRSSYLGHIGTAEEVREWCMAQVTDVDFATKFHLFSGTALRSKILHDLRPT